MWYHIRAYPYKGAIVFSNLHCVDSKLKAMWLKRKEQKARPDSYIEIKEDMEHSDPDYKQFLCPDCGNLMSKREIDKTWDWAGPHCNKCGCTGMEMFVSVVKHHPPQSSRSEVDKLEKEVKEILL
jgi:predicted RNA-binding Zn-ribbon protein involved in translation (DUF1610 family)